MRSMSWSMMAIALVIGCDSKEDDTAGSDGGSSGISAEDQATAEAIWSEISGYESWGQLEGYDGVREGTSGHTNYVQVWFNDSALTAASAGATLTDGDIGVKETYADEAGSELSDITVYKVIDGFSSDHNDMFWVKYSPSGDVQVAGEASACYGCHEGADSNGDLVTINE